MTSWLFEPFLERDREGIGRAIRDFRSDHSSDELFSTVGRFAILSYAPSQHSKHAVLACAAAHELTDAFGAEWDDLLVECALYAAESRQPWSEPPILDPPPVGPDQRGDLAELREAVETRDRLRGERWLAMRIDDANFARDYFLAAADDFEDMGHKLAVAVAAWKLAGLLGEKGRFAALRISVWEMTAYGGHVAIDERGAPSPDELMERLIASAVANEGSLDAMHSILLLDAATQAASIAGEPLVLERACAYLRASVVSAPVTKTTAAQRPKAYHLARDYATLLEAHAVAQRWRTSHPAIDAAVAAAARNLERSSFDEMTFA